MPIVLKSGSLSLLEPSGPVQACNGIALPLPYLIAFSLQHWLHQGASMFRNTHIACLISVTSLCMTPCKHFVFTCYSF